MTEPADTTPESPRREGLMARVAALEREKAELLSLCAELQTRTLKLESDNKQLAEKASWLERRVSSVDNADLWGLRQPQEQPKPKSRLLSFGFGGSSRRR